MPKSGIDLVIKRAIEKYADPNYEPPVSLMDRPNTVVYPALQREDHGMPRSMGNQLGEMAMQMSEQLMGEMGGGMMPGGEMMGGVDAGAMMMDPGMSQAPAQGALPEEGMPLPHELMEFPG